MGTVSSERAIPAAWVIENHGAPGVVGVLSRDSTQAIRVTLKGEKGSETIELVRIGDSCNFDLLNIDQVVIEADTYPTLALINFTNMDIDLAAAPYTSPGPPTVHKDLIITTATTTALWTPAAGKRFVITSLLISTDTAQLILAVDDTNAVNRRLAGGYFGATGGLKDETAHASGAQNRVLKIVTAAVGNTFVAVDGYETT